ncbi:MAG TPA: YihY/virulence factor BrkB family protein [Syntrophales bacterium]|nr:YihY/virulence factor BrkB family protein [Syntrophales bacterium]HOL59665.1 YihY/virulence factor BrkB family protein [Syntrophales bacterium]HPO35811.1 YihY/virulence factor BrkB family protein [Syntrophales bacterium]
MKKLGLKLKGIWHFLLEDIWRIRRTTLPSRKASLLSLVRVLVLSVRGFNEDKCQLRASALTFYSLVSIVPILAMAFGIAQGFGLEKLLEAQLREMLAGYEEILAHVLTFSHSLLKNTKGGLIAGAGLIVLFWAVIKVLGQIEYAFNDIWGVKKPRSFGRKCADYLSVMLICPVIIVLSGGVTVFLSAQLSLVMNKFAVLGGLRGSVLFFLRLLPYAMMWGLFTFLYFFLPNTRVRMASALLGGVVAGTIFQVVQWAYITFQIGVARYNAIYGSFAALPMFLAWMQISWLILLYGAELAFAHQNEETYEFEPDAARASHRLRVLLSLRLMHHLVHKFIRGEKAPTAREISQELEIPIRFVNDLLYDLTRSHLAVMVNERDGDGEPGYQPALDPQAITVHYVIDKLEREGVNELPFLTGPAYEKLISSLHALSEQVRRLPENVCLKDIKPV